MTSEELTHRYPNDEGQKVGDMEVFQTQLTTLTQYAKHGLLPDTDYGPYATQKCDSLVIRRQPVLSPVVIGEDKATGGVNASNWKKLAKNLLLKKLIPTRTAIGYLTDGARTHWINGAADEVVEIVREDGKPMPTKIDFNDEAFGAELQYIVDHFDPVTGKVAAPSAADPHALAQQVWQTIWRLKADRPEDCLATFVELFIFKFLDDLGLLKKDDDGLDVSLQFVLGLDRETCYRYYYKTVRPFIKRLFPAGSDGLSIINGIVLQPTNRDHNFIFHELLKKFVKFGSLRNTSPEFKTKLYESFLQESDTTTTFGQFFTPRRVVSAIHDMAQVEKLAHGKTICDPACGVGGFILEQMARDIDSQFVIKGNKIKPTHDWLAYDIVPKTAILAKANALVHCGDLLANQPGRVGSFANWLNETFTCVETTSLGALDKRPENEFDLVVTNPPFVVSGSADIGKLVKQDSKRRKYFDQKYNGVEGLFLQMIVKGLKPNGDAWVLLPETFFLRSTDKVLRDWVFANCKIDLLALLPERTFFNTPKRVVVAHMKKRPKALSAAGLDAALGKEEILLYAVSEIGETRDARRLLIQDNDLPELVETYKRFAAGVAPTKALVRAVAVPAIKIKESRSINIRHYWEKSTAQELGLLGADEDPVKLREQVQQKMDALTAAALAWSTSSVASAAPPAVLHVKKIRLGDTEYFRLRIGKRVLKKDIYTKLTGVPLYSANVRKPFGYVNVANAGDLTQGGALWSIDSDFDCKGVAPGEVYSITDHCGQIELVVDGIDPRYFAAQIRSAGNELGFNRDYRPSLNVMADLEIELPIDGDGNFDAAAMTAWADYEEEVQRYRDHLASLIKE
ncbi:N-6 DNA methylase [Lysobacter sp. 5GHs7-4]|uniref:HsdM family class I SAM-dependent methyltransferase n=1 Tax=Lysobacter sp. 5GHs7-4 TaxID=2904253 RepID=UPI001E4478CB|nr:N-6 DNA methylase [Lysobacter sp. 5GHs7-4]UHQ23970.1 N-6 DNA methylase [Lysobacter sp. 5GHs7-4]